MAVDGPGPTLYFVRHGETDWNAEGRLQGQRDVPLNARGRVQAERAGAKLRAAVPDVEALDYVASPLARTRETMELLRAALGLAPGAYRTEEPLKELCFGAWEGLTWKEIRARDPEGWAARERDKWGFVPADGESYAMVAARVMPVVAALTRDAVVVSHGGIARVLLHRFCGVSQAAAPRVDIWQGRLLTIRRGAYAWT